VPWRRPRIALIGILALAGGVLFGASAQPVVASSPTHLGSRVAALAKSPLGRSGRSALEKVLTSPSLTALVQELMKQYGNELTPFQLDIANVDLMLANPRVRSLFSKLNSGHHLTRAQIKRLRKLASATRSNPAVALLSRVGQELKSNPAALTADIAALENSPTGSTLSPSTATGSVLESSVQSLGAEFASASVTAIATKLRSILSSPGSVEYVQTLPPLLVASLVPISQVESYVVPAVTAKAARRFTARDAGFSLGLSSETQARLKYDLLLARITAEDISDELGEALAIGVGIPPGLLHVLGLWDTATSASELYVAGRQLQDVLAPSNLQLDPSFAEVSPNKEVVFTVNALTTEDTPSGPELTPLGPDGSALGPVSFTLSIADGNCFGSDGHGCTAVHAGEHTVTATATDSGKTVQGTIKIIPGPIAALRVSPDPNTQEVAPGTAQAYTVEEVDEWDNKIGPLAIGDSPGQAQLKIEPDGTCDDTLGTCTPEKPGVHTVTASDSPYVGRATLNVAGAPAPPSGGPYGEIEITTSSLPDATLNVPYSFVLESSGGDPNLPGHHPLNWYASQPASGPQCGAPGTLPYGLEIDGNTGEIYGTPAEVGVFDFEITVSKYEEEPFEKPFASRCLSLTVNP
jgi:hypothetical protein